MEDHASRRLTRLWRDDRVLKIAGQVIFVALAAALAAWLIGNLNDALDARGLSLSFSFLRRTAGFAITEGVGMERTETFWRAYQVGVLNSLNVVVAGLVLTTFVGLLSGVALLSPNWLLRNLVRLYVEIMRNTPLLVQLFFIYFGIILKLPSLENRIAIGPLLPPVPNPPSPRARKEAIEQASQEMMQAIRALVPDGAADHSAPAEDHYTFRVELTAPDGSAVALPDELAIPYGEELAYYFHRPLLLEVLYRNYRIADARPLASFPTLTDPARLGAALDVALGFYEREPAFLGYRLGYARAGRVLAGLRALRQAMAWAAVQNCQMHVIPERTIMKSEEEIETVTAPSIRREF